MRRCSQMTMPSAATTTDRDRPEGSLAIGEGCRDAVAIALQMNQAGRGDALGVFDKAVERRDAGIRARTSSAQRSAMVPASSAVRRLRPELFASLAPASRSGRPAMESGAWVARADDGHPGRSSRPVPSPSPMPDCRTRLEQVVAGHGQEAGVDLPLLAAADLVDGVFMLS
jgi:hypothetical protein